MGIQNDQLYQHGRAITNSANRVQLVTLPKKGNKKLTHHDIDHDLNGLLWCGLAAISAVTGVKTSRIRDLVKRYRKNPQSPVTGTNEYEVEYVLKHLGYQMENACYYGGKDQSTRPSLSKWLDETRKLRVNDVAYLIAFRPCKSDPNWHWGVVQNGLYLCTFTNQWVELKKAPWRRRKIEHVFAIKRVK